MLANVVGVPLGAFAGQLLGWRGPFWALAALALAAIGLITRYVPDERRDGSDHPPVSIRSELTALRSGRLWLALAACATTTGGVLSTYSYIAPLLVALLGLFGLAANLVLIALAVRFAAGSALGSALRVSAFNLGTAAGSWVAGLALDSTLGVTGPAVVGTVIAALTVIPTTAIALAQRRSSISAT
jgi:DHA1 family inner membrane transport protein